MFAHNTSVQASTNETPFYLLYGRDPLEPSDLNEPMRYRLTTNENNIFAQQWEKAMKIVQSELQKSQLRQKDYYDRKAVEFEFEVGETVLLK